jgi:hypothetical protein
MALERFGDFVGEWIGEAEVMPNPWTPSGPARGDWSFRLDRAGVNLIHDYRHLGDEGSWFEGHGVLTVDPESREILWFWFDRYGHPPVPPSRGGWEGNSLILEKTTPRGVGRSVFTLADDRLGYEVSSRGPAETLFTPVMIGTYRRA